MTPADHLAQLVAFEDRDRAVGMAAYHKAPRRYLGIANPVIGDFATAIRRGEALDARLAIARHLWDSDIHEARIAAAKILTQARIRPDDTAAWDLIRGWVPKFDAWAIADHACEAGRRRLRADPARLDTVETWTSAPDFWTRRAALVITLPWARGRHPSPQDTAIRERVLGWAAGYVDDREWFIQKAIAWWLRDLSRQDPDRARAFLATHGARLKPFARREAGKHL